jgi:hypothetical protein
MSNQSITFEPIDVNQSGKTIYESKITVKENGKDMTPLEETNFIHQKYSGFAPSKFISESAKRDFVKIELDHTQKSCIDLKAILRNYDERYESSSVKATLDSAKITNYNSSVKIPESGDEEKEFCKMKLRMNWFYYYNGERLTKANTDVIQSAVKNYFKTNPKMVSVHKDKKKELLSKLNFDLQFKNENGEDETVNINMKDIEQRKEIDTNIFYRKCETLPTNYKKPSECSEEELVAFYGDPQEPMDIRTPEQFDEIYGHRHDEGYKHHNKRLARPIY